MATSGQQNNKKEHSDKRPAKQGAEGVIAEPNKITSSTAYDFEAKNLTAYDGLLPVATMLEKLGFRQLIEETLTVKRVTRTMPMYQFILAMVLAVYVGFSRLHHVQFLDPPDCRTCSTHQNNRVAHNGPPGIGALKENQMRIRTSGAKRGAVTLICILGVLAPN